MPAPLRSASSLVLQGPEADAAGAAALAARTGAAQVEALGAHAFRLRGAQPREDLAGWCRERRLDWAWVPPGRRLEDLRLIAMDMDSTLITIECIDELGALAGRRDEIAAVTGRAMRGEIPYAVSLRQRVALLEGLDEGALEEVYDEKLRLAPGAERLAEECRGRGIALLLVSGGFSFFAERLGARLGFADTLANLLEIEGGRLTGRVLGTVVDADEKAGKFRGMAERLGARREQTCAIGDGANDLAMLAEAGLSVAWRAKPVVRERADCTLDYAGLDAVLNLFERLNAPTTPPTRGTASPREARARRTA